MTEEQKKAEIDAEIFVGEFCTIGAIIANFTSENNRLLKVDEIGPLLAHTNLEKIRKHLAKWNQLDPYVRVAIKLRINLAAYDEMQPNDLLTKNLNKLFEFLEK